jgi:RNA recognition motif-containing protein
MSQEVYVDGFPASVTEVELRHVFAQCGPVLSVEILTTVEGLSIGIARIRMASGEDVERAIGLLHHATLNGRTLLVFRSSTALANGQAIIHTATE